MARHFVQKSCKDNGLPAKVVSQDSLRMLMGYHWPGNIRQFENAIEHAVALSGASLEIGPESLPDQLRERATESMAAYPRIPDEGICFTDVVSGLERDLILQCLEKTGGNKRQAARLLNLSRTTFIDKLQRLQVA